MRKFDLKPITVIPTVVPYLLNGEDAPAILEEYNRLVDSKFKGNPKLKVLKLIDIDEAPTIIGSNPLILPVVQQIVTGFRVAKPEEIETTLQEKDPIRIRGNHYVDYGITLDFTGANHDLAIKFFRTLPKELRELDRLPALIVGYGLKNSDIGKYGVIPKYQEGTEFRTAKILCAKGDKFEENDNGLKSLGLPSRLGQGKRRLHNRTQNYSSLDNLGISGLYLSGALSLNSGYVDDLAGSDDSGRVVLVSKDAGEEGR